MRSFGVEEEMLLVDPDTGVAVALAEAVTGGGEDGPESELKRQQVETDTVPCTTLDELSDQLRAERRAAADAAACKNCRVAALVRGLAETAAREWDKGEPPSPVRTELLRLASWRASRSGLEGELVHPVTARPASAETVVRALLEHVTPALADLGDLDAAAELTGRLLSDGNGATLQRRTYERTGDLAEVVRAAVTRTLAG